MKTGFNEIKPFQGLGDLAFGMTREQAESLLGAPTEKEKYSLDASAEEQSEEWHYDDDALSLSFDEIYDWKLSSIAISDEGYTLEGATLIGQSLEHVKGVFENKGWGELEEDADMDEEGSESQLFFVEEKGMSLWFEEGVLSELQWNAQEEESE